MVQSVSSYSCSKWYYELDFWPWVTIGIFLISWWSIVPSCTSYPPQLVAWGIIRLDPSPLKTMLKILFAFIHVSNQKVEFSVFFSLNNVAKKPVQHVSFSHLICSSNLIHTQYLKVEKKSPLRLHSEHRHYNVTMSWWNSLTLVLNRWEVHGIHSHMSNLGI